MHGIEEMVVRKAVVTDAPGIARVHVVAWQVAYRDVVAAEHLANLDVDRCAAAWTRELGNPEWPAYVLDDEGVVRGLCSTGACTDSDLDGDVVAEIPALYLDPKIWGQGLGRRLCEAAIGDLRQRGFTEVVAWVLDGNERAAGFYRALGFAADGIAKRHPRIGGELQRYRMCLDPGSRPA
jgi:ribosomal protein S18 acetylase RimI-like enzyme